MRNLIITVLLFFAFNNVYAQSWTWDSRYEESAYQVKINMDEALTTIVTKPSEFDANDFYQVEYLCLEDDAEGVFKLEQISPTQVKFYHLSAFDELNIELLLNNAIGAGNFSVGVSEPWQFPELQ